jgi:dihydroxy-acid dehydratase
MTEYFSPVLQGDAGALKRALYNSLGFDDESLSKPIIAIANSYTNVTPGHVGFNELCNDVCLGVAEAGGTAMVFGTIAPCDGIAEGHDGMRYILPARDIIAASVECMVRAHRFDGVVFLGSCDKIVPGMLMSAARLDLPSILLNSGPMYPVTYKGRDYDGNIVTEAEGWKRRGEIDEAEFQRIENIAEPCAGSCAMLGTANTMCCLSEAIGMSLPGSAAVPAVLATRRRLARQTGRAIVALVKRGVTARRIMTHNAFENAIRLLMAIGGSTNGIMHLQAIHREAGLGPLPLDTFESLSRETPQLARIYPASEYDMADFYEAGGVPSVMRELSPLLHGDALTVAGLSLADALKNFEGSPRREVVRTLDNPYAIDGGVAILKGNLAPGGAVVKPAAIPPDMMYFTGPAHVFSSEKDAMDGILGGIVKPGTVLVLRYEGPKGGPGMPEMYYPMKYLEGMGLSDKCALITDGRFSGSNRGCFVGHISPEAYEGGILACVEDGDDIEIDIPNRTLSVRLAESEIADRMKNWSPPKKTLNPGILGLFRQLSLSAADGAGFALD